MNQLKLDKARFDDLHELMQLEAACFSEGERDSEHTYRKKILHSHAFLLARNVDDHLIGHFIAEAWPAAWLNAAQVYQLGDNVTQDDGKTLFVASICIHPKFHGRGFAKDLLHLSLRTIIVEARSRARMFESIIAAIREDNHSSLALFQKLGFRAEYEKDGFFPNRPDIKMRFFRLQADLIK